MRLIDADALNVRSYCRWFDDPDDVRVVERMIREAPTITPPPNDPLTLEQLRELDGEPVWNDTMKQWAIVDTHDRRTINVCGRWRPLSDRYYRRKPEEGTA